MAVFTFFNLNHKIRNNFLIDGDGLRIEISAHFWRKFRNHFQRVFQILFFDIVFLNNLVVMLIGKCIELISKDIPGETNCFVGTHLLFDLQQQTFLKISCANSRWIKFLHVIFQNIFHFFFGGINSLRKSKIINQLLAFSSQIPVVIQVSDDVFCNFKIITFDGN